jgi:hypothetical protein
MEVLETVRKAVPVPSLFLSYMELLFYVSRGKIGGTDTGKRDYRNQRGVLIMALATLYSLVF